MEKIIDFFFNQGILGIIIIVLGFVIVHLNRRLDTKDAEIKALNIALQQAILKRGDDVLALSTKQIEVQKDQNFTLDAVVKTTDAIRLALDTIKG